MHDLIKSIIIGAISGTLLRFSIGRTTYWKYVRSGLFFAILGALSSINFINDKIDNLYLT